MDYLLIYTESDIVDRTVTVKCEKYDDFEEMMIAFTLKSSSRDRVMVIECNTKKVVCFHEEEGRTMFNRYLLDAVLFEKVDNTVKHHLE